MIVDVLFVPLHFRDFLIESSVVVVHKEAKKRRSEWPVSCTRRDPQSEISAASFRRRSQLGAAGLIRQEIRLPISQLLFKMLCRK